MTTKELIKDLGELGYKVAEVGNIIWLYEKDSELAFNSQNIMRIDKTKFLGISTYTRYDKLDDYHKMQLWEVVKEYIETPVDEREEKDKYYLVLDEIGKGHCGYINYDKVDKDIFISNKTNDERYQTQFEDYEIENLRKKFPKLVGIATKVKVEEDE